MDANSSSGINFLSMSSSYRPARTGQRVINSACHSARWQYEIPLAVKPVGDLRGQPLEGENDIVGADAPQQNLLPIDPGHHSSNRAIDRRGIDIEAPHANQKATTRVVVIGRCGRDNVR